MADKKQRQPKVGERWRTAGSSSQPFPEPRGRRPKVRFELSSARFETYALCEFCKPPKTGWDWSGEVFRVHPRLKASLSRAKTGKERLAAVRRYASQFIEGKRELLKNKKRRYQKEWGRINDRYMDALSDVVETGWPANRPTITAYPSLNPISLRFLDDWSFTLCLYRRLKDVRRLTAHELLHFLYFKKWKETFPDADRRTFDAPHLEWHLSEILAPAILNDPRIQRVIRSREKGYREYGRKAIDGKSIIEHFGQLYRKSRARGDSFARFLEIAYKEAKKNKSAILNA